MSCCRIVILLIKQGEIVTCTENVHTNVELKPRQ